MLYLTAQKTLLLTFGYQYFVPNGTAIYTAKKASWPILGNILYLRKSARAPFPSKNQTTSQNCSLELFTAFHQADKLGAVAVFISSFARFSQSDYVCLLFGVNKFRIAKLHPEECHRS